MSHPAALPESWITEIFRRLMLTYGRNFLGRWEGVDVADVKADWSRQLAGLPGRKIAHALETLPATNDAPSVLQFRDAALRCPEPALLALPAPKVDIPPRVAEALADIADRQCRDGPLQWAYRLQEREAKETDATPGRARMSPFQRDAWREALAGAAADVAMAGAYVPPPAHSLPPGMRRAEV